MEEWKFEDKENEKDDFYEAIEESLEDDEITAAEEGFMRGYEEG